MSNDTVNPQTVPVSQHRFARFAARLGSLYGLIAVFIVVTAIMLPWHLHNHRIPFWDEASYVETAQNILQRFDQGWFAGLKGFYLIRNWRPIIFPAVFAPILAATSGRILLAVGLAQWLTLELLAVYAFLLFRRLLPTARALVATTFIVTTPWLLGYGYVLFSELLWLATTVAFVFHLVAGLAARRQSDLLMAGLWLGLMGATRPAETVLMLTVPIVLLAVRDLSSTSEASALNAGAFALQAAALVAATARLIQVGSPDWLSVSLVVAFAVVVAARARMFFLQMPVLGMALVAETVMLIWYLPRMKELYLWVYETSFGPMSKLPYGSFTGRSPAPLMTAILNAFHWGALAFLGSIAAMPLLVRRASLWSDASSSRAVKLLLLGLAMLAPMLVTLWITQTMDTRRVMPGMLLLYLSATALALHPAHPWSQLRFGLVAAMAATQLAAAAANGWSIHFQPLQDAVGPLMPPATGIDPNAAVLDRVQQMGVRSGRLAVYTLCYREPLVGCQRRGYPMIEPVAMSTLARERGLPVYINFYLKLDFTRPETLAARLNEQGYFSVLVDSFDQPDQVAPNDPVFEHTFGFIALIRNGLPPGLRQIGEFNFGGRDFYLLRAQAASVSASKTTARARTGSSTPRPT